MTKLQFGHNCVLSTFKYDLDLKGSDMGLSRDTCVSYVQILQWITKLRSGQEYEHPSNYKCDLDLENMDIGLEPETSSKWSRHICQIILKFFDSRQSPYTNVCAYNF
jgi:hypothetical protein